MKIRTSLVILSATSLVLLAIIGLITFRAFRQIEAEIEESNNAGKLIKDVFELNIITYQFLIYHEERMQQQWTLKYDSIRAEAQTGKGATFFFTLG